MKKIICFGEALIDMLNTEHSQYTAFVGGAPANVAVGIAKLGGQASFIGQVGADKFGRSIREFLSLYKVDVEHLLSHPYAKTALAFVQLDDTGDRSFSFYREQTADVLMDKSQLNPNSLSDAAILHLCSNTLTTQTGFELSLGAIELAKQHNTVVSFDLNLRDELWPNSQIDLTRVDSIIELADVVKFSAEELELISASEPHYFIANKINSGTSLVLVTHGDKPIEYFSKGFSGHITVPETNVVDTTGAGDSFVAGFLTAIANSLELAEVVANQDRLRQVIAFASECSAVTVSRYGSCASFPVIEEVKNRHGIL